MTTKDALLQLYRLFGHCGMHSGHRSGCGLDLLPEREVVVHVRKGEICRISSYRAALESEDEDGLTVGTDYWLPTCRVAAG